jgi:hypothetical protein
MLFYNLTLTANYDQTTYGAIQIITDTPRQCFSTFFGSRHPVRLKKIWWRPKLAKMIIQGTLRSKKLKSKFNICGHPCVGNHCSKMLGQQSVTRTFLAF